MKLRQITPKKSHRWERTPKYRISSIMELGPMRAEELHAEAERCQRLASESLDMVVREALIELASHYERQAERLEQQSGETES
jgi:hypothetical protein